MSLRRVVFALAALCLMVGVASAQVPVNQQLSCAVSSSSQPSLRAESTHELVGDVLIQCTGGAQPNPTTAQVPAVDITVNYGTAITSRQNTAGSPAVTYSDAALVIDDPNSGNPIVTNYGPGAAMIACGNIPAAGSSAPACNTFLYPQTVSSVVYYTSDAGGSTAGTATGSAANVYQGVITGGGQAVTFYGVPLAAPITAGIYRRFRVVNVRVAPGSSTISATVTPSGPNAALLNISGSTSATVGAGKLAFGYSFTNAAGVASVPSVVSQCITPQNVSAAIPNPVPPFYSPYVALLSYSESFANAAKPQGATATPVGYTGLTVYGVYTSESEVVLPALAKTTSSGSNGQNAATPGAADAGTRFKAVFAGLPYSKTGGAQPAIYVSLGNVTGFTTDAGGGTNGTAVLTGAAGNPTSEFAAFATNAPGVGLYTNPIVSGANPSIVPLTIASTGTATAVWEVTALPAGKSPTFTFAVYIAYGSATASLSNATVTLSAAPVQPATQPSPAEAVQIPSFTTTPVGPSPVLTIVPCQTALLFPFVSTTRVTTTQHWETGIAIANTGGDPWNSVPVVTPVPATSTCTISFYGTGVGTGASTFVPPNVTGPPIGPGQNWAFVASDPLATGLAPNVGFAGYAFAVCNFTYAHGFAFIEDNSPTGNAMGYLALVVNNGIDLPLRPTALNGEGLTQ